MRGYQGRLRVADLSLMVPRTVAPPPAVILRTSGESDRLERRPPTRAVANSRLSSILVRISLDLHRDLGRSGISATGQQRSKSSKDDPLWRVLQATQGRRHAPTVGRSFRWCLPVPGSGGHRLARKFNHRLLVRRTPLVGQRRLNQPLLDGLDLQSEESRVDAHLR